MTSSDTDIRSKRTAPPEVRRLQLIEATMATIAEKGVSGTTMALVTKRAGLSIGTVNLHFDSKDNLLKATLQHLADELEAEWRAVHQDPILTPAQKLWGIVDASFAASVCTKTKIRVWFGFFGEIRYRDFYRETVGQYDDDRGLVMEELLLMLKDGQRGAVFEADALTQSLEAMSDGLWLSIMLYPDWVTPAEARRRLWELLANHFPDRFPRTAEPGLGSVQ